MNYDDSLGRAETENDRARDWIEETACLHLPGKMIAPPYLDA